MAVALRQVSGGEDRVADTAGDALAADAGPSLALTDLVADTNGELVLFNDSGLRSLTILTEQGVVDEGRSGRHVTAAGEDVTGFRYFRFEGGTTLFFPGDLELFVATGG